jgi:hypothetical protein
MHDLRGELSVAHRIAPRVAWQVLDGEAVLIDLEGSKALGLNPAGSFLWARLQQRTESELADDLAGEYRLDSERARGDVAAFLALMRQRGFIQE